MTRTYEATFDEKANCGWKDGPQTWPSTRVYMRKRSRCATNRNKTTKSYTITSISRTTVRWLKVALESEALDKLLNPGDNLACKKPILSLESQLIKQRIEYAASRVFALNRAYIKRTMTQVAADGHKSFRAENDTPYSDSICSCRSKHCDMTFRKAYTHHGGYRARKKLQQRKHVTSLVALLHLYVQHRHFLSCS